MYEKGQGVKQDYAQAVKWYRKAAEQGDFDAQNNLRAICDMEKYIEIINKIKSLNLKDYPQDIVKGYLKQLKKFFIFKKILPKNSKIIRGRINKPGERFDNVSDHSYKPKKCNKTYQRASTPNNTMFYGAVTPDKILPGENQLERITVFSELYNSINFLKDDESEGEIKITFAGWEVIEDIHLAAIHPHKSLLKSLHYNNYLKKEFLKILKNSNLTEKDKNRYLKISEFLSEEFSKEEIIGDYDYLISAVFSELVCESDFDGVYYPSVRMEGNGINVAIKPTSVDSKMVFKRASESILKHNGINEPPRLENYSRSISHEEGHLQYRKVEGLGTITVKRTRYKLPFDPHTPQIYNGLFFNSPYIPDRFKKVVESFFKRYLESDTSLKEYRLTIEKCDGSIWVEGFRMD